MVPKQHEPCSSTTTAGLRDGVAIRDDKIKLQHTR